MILVIRFHEQFARFIIQAGLGKGHDEEASDHRKNVRKCSSGRPVLFERIDANSARASLDVGMVYFGEEETPGRGGGEIGR